MSNPIVAADRWLFGVLTGIASGGVHGHVVPSKQDGVAVSLPYVFYTLAATADNLLTGDANIVWSPLVYSVRYVDKADSYVPLETGAAAITAALHKASGSNVSGVIAGCVYEAPFAMAELDSDGTQIRHLGGLYRLYVQ